MSRPRQFFSRRGAEVEAPKYLVIHDTDLLDTVQSALVDKGHAARGYDLSELGSHVCYHFMVGKDGTVKQLRALTEREYCTRNESVNAAAIQIVVAGQFETEWPTSPQMRSLKSLITQLDSIYHFQRIMMHKDASPTACPGKNMVTVLNQWHLLRNNVMGQLYMVSRYYSPIEGQTTYYRKGDDAYLADVKMNCGLNGDGSAGDCSTTADGHKLTPEDAYKVAACPPEVPFGTQIQIDGIGTVTCHDHGSAIKQKRIDVWAGYGEEGLRNIATGLSGYLSVHFLPST